MWSDYNNIINYNIKNTPIKSDSNEKINFVKKK